MPRRIHLLERSFPGQPALDTAVSRQLLQEVSERRAPESLRLYRPDDVLAFALQDAARPGFERAVAASRAHGFEPVLRLAGGHAAVFHRETVAFAWCIPDPNPRAGIGARFEELSSLVASALRRLGVDARVGEVAGEYCPGAHSVNAGGRRKLMGVGQRVIRNAAYVGGVIVVREGKRVSQVLEPVYRELALAFDPETAGSVEDEIGAVSRQDVVEALRSELRDRWDLTVAELGDQTVADAARFESRHQVGARVVPAPAQVETSVKIVREFG